MTQDFAEMLRVVQDGSPQDKEVFKEALGWEQPSAKVRDELWKTIIYATVIILVGTFAVIAAAGFLGAAAKPELLTMFTGTLGFLAGLLAPSPVKKNGA